ncbi:C-GCAxxG-C-C family protein [Ruminococcus flavefaciens]|uniref:C_GCAxxG_C_C family protein n=1 Tax=Ruminococcus flavefaciens 007c TaxID=1341157 RepID=W7UMC3_RUMFL|nr:C-GCAxxG-C-C family protein [Ruminococcus flavefaciens]EWM54948.1 hypothetical protein RF007C_11455 [Ruminococcus flavefaciens 007c]
MDRTERAVEIKHSGSNCCQAVLLAFAEELGQDENTLRAMGAAFGCGMGAFDATCGALCASEMILGLKKYSGIPVLAEAKALHAGFRSMCGSTHCGELKGIKTGKMLCSCDDCVRNAVKLAEKMI